MKAAWLLLFATLTADAGEADLIFDRVKGFMVTVTAIDERSQIEGSGTGIIVAPGQVVTNCHVVLEASSVRISFGEKSQSAKLVLEDQQRDLCQLEVVGLDAKPAPTRSTSDVQPGETVYAVGNQLGMGLAVSSGIISAVKELPGQRTLFSTTPIAPGSSGGGLFDAQARLIGITSAMLRRGQNYNVSIPVEYLQELAVNGKRPATPADLEPEPDWVGQAEQMRASGQWSKLEVFAQRWGAAYPESSAADELRGLALYNLGQHARAQSILRNAVELDQRNASAYAILAMTLRAMNDVAAAEKALDKAFQLNPANGFMHAVKASWQFSAKEYPALQVTARRIIELNPWDERGWIYLAAAQHGLRNYDDAIQSYRAVLRLSPGNEAAKSGLAALLTARGGFSDARQLLEEKKAAYAYDAEGWVRLGMNDEDGKRYADAERSYRKAISLDPKFAGAWHRLGVVLMMTGRGDEGEKSIRKAIEIRPEVADGWLDLANALLARGAKSERREAIEKAYRLEPESIRAAFDVAAVRHEVNDFPGMIEPLEKVVRMKPTYADSWAWLGHALVQVVRLEDGYKALVRAKEIDPDNRYMLYAFSIYYGAIGRYAESLDYSEKALAIDGASVFDWNNKGYSLRKMGRFTEAAAALEVAVRLQPDFGPAWINLGDTYLQQRQFGKAITALERALVQIPTAFDARYFLIQAFAASGLFDKANSELVKLIKQAPDHAPVWFLKGELCLAQKDGDGARAAYIKLKQLSPVLARDFFEKARIQFPSMQEAK